MEGGKCGKELDVAVRVIKMAGLLCQRVQDDLIGRNREQIQSTGDDSVATAADITSPTDNVESMRAQEKFKKKKVVWDDKSLEIFINICVDQKLQELPNAAKFRERGLDHAQKLEFLFRDIGVAGEKPWASSSSNMVPQGDLWLTKIDDGMNETLFEGLDESSHDNDVDIDNPVPVSISRAIPCLGVRGKLKKKVSSKSPGKKTKNERIMARLSRKLELICDAVESRSSVTSKRIESKPENTIEDALAALRSIPEIERGSDLFMLATELFLKKEYREMFLALKDADLQVAFLRRFYLSYEVYEEKMKDNATGVVIMQEAQTMVTDCRNYMNATHQFL
ncbi:hypothetical protein J5N97_009215 [Dioscorea zingiberensis]|uniref:Uncharacterized protein n=1 Tax=Dioscorea zingiberensis TaxID=325984 RepID=A0A9D5CVY9_9LILI|nr:hypothetical protein J5N97_009215 [Dioscorea zingiberensis]